MVTLHKGATSLQPPGMTSIWVACALVTQIASEATVRVASFKVGEGPDQVETVVADVEVVVVSLVGSVARAWAAERGCR